MNGNHPKRRRDKYNPYHICELEGHYYISFQDGQGVLQEFEITQTLYREVESEESWRQNSGLTNRNHIRLCMGIRWHYTLKSKNCTELCIVNVADAKAN